MIKTAIRVTILSLVLFCSGMQPTGGAIAQSTSQPPAEPTVSPSPTLTPAPITPAKKALIQELLELSNAKANATVLMTQTLANMEANMPGIISNMLANSGMQGEDLKQRTSEFATRVIKRYKERLPQVINLSAATEQISYALYDKFFSDSDLSNMIAFYKSPTGRKVVSVSPQLIAESVKLSNQLVLPKVLQVMQEIIRDEMKRLPPR